jgi:hypothetical protein
MLQSRPSARARLAGLTVLLLGGTYAVQIPRLVDVAAYLGVLAGSGFAVACLAAVRLWFGGHMDGRLSALTLSAVGLAGHLLNLLAGLPGATVLRGHVSPVSIVSIALDLLTIVLLVSDAARHPSPGQRRHPYAL